MRRKRRHSQDAAIELEGLLRQARRNRQRVVNVERERKRQERDGQGWQKRRPLSYNVLVPANHGQDEKRKWVPA